MKLNFCFLFLTVVGAPVLSAARPASGLRHENSEDYQQHWQHNLRRELEDSGDGSSSVEYGLIASDDADTSACIEVKNSDARRGTKLILGDCNSPQNGWRGDSDGLIHTELDPDFCMQAGHGGPAKSGENVRLYDCDSSNTLQQWVFINGGGIRPKDNQDLCIVWRGVNANVNIDPLLLKPCAQVEDRNDWSNDPFPDDDDEDDRSPCVDRSVPQFIIDDNIDIGDTLVRPGPAFAVECGPDCYTVKDNGDDPPFDPELGDTLRFAYKEITSNNFSLRARICGVGCDGQDQAGTQLFFGRTGLMVRDSLDPLARNVFVSHSPDGQADWSYRTVAGGETILGFDGSPDVRCLWVSLTREGANFSGLYSYEGSSQCELDYLESPILDFTVEMPETVYVGLAVSTAVSPPYCTYTEADFYDIECRGC